MRTPITLEDCARVCHEANRAFCLAIGDDSQKSWDEAEEWQRKSAIAGVTFVANNPDAGPWAQHEAWAADKKKDGWKYGPVKNAETKEHPCLVDYFDLPRERRAKDYLFISIVKAMIVAGREA